MSVVTQTQARSSRNFNLRAYLAGGAATTALVVGAIVVFASLAAYVGFNGLPVGGDDGPASELVVGSGAPESAAAALGAAPGAVAATAAADTPVAPAAAPAPGAPGQPVGAPGDPGTVPGSGTAPGAPASPPADGPAALPGVPGGGGTETLNDIVDEVEQTTGLPLSEVTDPVTGPIEDAVNDVGGALSDEQSAVGGLTEGLLGD
jgi:hypothetical protein